MITRKQVETMIKYVSEQLPHQKFTLDYYSLRKYKYELLINNSHRVSGTKADIYNYLLGLKEGIEYYRTHIKNKV